MVFNSDGLSLQGLTGAFNHDRRVDFPIKPEMRKGVTLYIEVTCNGMFGVDGPSEGDPDPNRYFALNSCDIVVKRPEGGCMRRMQCVQLYADIVYLHSLALAVGL